MDETIELVMINAIRCCGSTRRRLFWSNLPIIQPQEKNITYQSCVKNGYVDKEKSNVILGSQLTNCGGLFRYKKYNLGNLIYKKKEYTSIDNKELFATYSDVLRNSKHNGKSGSITDEFENPITSIVFQVFLNYQNY